jgi:hypothetical protein
MSTHRWTYAGRTPYVIENTPHAYAESASLARLKWNHQAEKLDLQVGPIAAVTPTVGLNHPPRQQQ